MISFRIRAGIAARPAYSGTLLVLAALAAVFLVELARHATGSEAALLQMGGLPNDGRLHGEHWRLITYSFLHFSWNHLLMNAALLWWTGRIVERRLGTPQAMGIYFFAVVASAAAVVILRTMHPKAGSTMGASGGVFALLAAALVLAYRPAAVAAFGKNAAMRVGLWIAFAIGVAISLRPGVSMAGHAGGLASGLLLGSLARVRRPGATVAAAIATLLVVFSLAGCSPTPDGDNQPPALAGAWRSKLQFNSGAFAAIQDLEFLYVFNQGGTMTESSNYDGAPPVPPAYGVWRQTAPGEFEAKYVFYATKAPARFEEVAGGGGWMPAGHGVFVERIHLGADAKSFTSEITYEAFDTAGKHVAGGGQAKGRGERIEF